MGNLGPNRKFDKDTSHVKPGKTLSIDSKIKILEELGREDLVNIFNDYRPRVSNRRKKGAPLDQRVTITVTDIERVNIDNEVKAIKALGDSSTMSQFIRSRAVSLVDIQEWKTKAEKALKELEEINKNQSDLRKKRNYILLQIEEAEDDEDLMIANSELSEIDKKLSKIVAQNEKRTQRLSGRMSRNEAETIKWRAQRLCLSASDYLRMVIFDLTPDSSADSHLSLDAKRRFYISIIDVANNGWGTAPNIYECSQCENYLEDNYKLKERVRQLETFLGNN